MGLGRRRTRARVTGVEDAKKNMRRAVEAAREAVEQEFDDYADEILQRSNDLAPQLTGQMIRNSGTDKDDGPNRFVRSVFYLDNYAVFQHEGRFNPGPITIAKPGAGRKFLQRPYDASKREFVVRLGRAIERSLRQSLR